MIRQYDSYTNVPASVYNLVLSKCSVLDEYIIMSTGTNTYSALVRDRIGNVTQYDIYREGNYNSYWTVTSKSATFDYQVTNEYYVVSNIGYGTEYVPPSVHYMTSWATSGLVCLAFLFVCIPWLMRRIFRK